MEPEDTSYRDTTDDPGDSHDSTPIESSESVTSSIPDQIRNEHWSRRTFLKAAALGTAAAAFLHTGESQGGTAGVGLGPLAALADDLSGLNCTANDVRIPSPGILLNEPCTCTSGTFNAQVQFRVINNTGTTRYCVTVHFCPVKLSNGTIFAPGDILIGDVPAKSDTNYTVTIPNYPCGQGLLCFGACGPGTDPDTGQPDCSFPKGTPCPTGQCCTTISWDVNPGCPSKVISSKCRHQQVCIQGFGAALTCTAGCTPTCGGTATLHATITGGVAPFTYLLTGSDGTSQKYPTSGTTTDTSHDFTVTVTQNTTYTLTVTDSRGCQRTATTSLSASPIAKPATPTAAVGCTDPTTGKAAVTLTAASGYASYTWFDGTTQIGTGNPLTVQLAPGDHSITVQVTDSNGCVATSDAVSVHVNQAVSVSAASGTPDCSGNVTLTATANGGAGGFSYKWFDGATQIGTTNPLTIQLAPGDHSITVTATDSAGCAATSAPIIVHINQPVTVSAAAGTPDCSGNVTLTATPSGGSGSYTSFVWFDGGSQIGTGNPLTVQLAPGDHSITVTATDSAGCAATSAPITVHINQLVATTLDCGTAPDCTGHLAFTASATGGTGTYTFAWAIDGTPVSGNTGPTLAYPPTVDCTAHVVAVAATDNAGCPSGNTASRTVTQVVATTVSGC